MIRPAILADLEAIVAIAMSETQRYPQLKADKEKIRRGVINAISSASHFCWVSEDTRGAVRGVLLALTGNNLWAQRNHSNIVVWTTEVVGDGAKLLRQFREWIRSRRAVRVAGMSPDLNGIDPRVWKLAERMGFERHGGAYVLYN